MSARIADVIELRTGISQKLFDETTGKAIENLQKEGKVKLNSQQLEEFSKEYKLHEFGSVDPDKFKKDYCRMGGNCSWSCNNGIWSIFVFITKSVIIWWIFRCCNNYLLFAKYPNGINDNDIKCSIIYICRI